jgi:hypothetical protein
MCRPTTDPTTTCRAPALWEKKKTSAAPSSIFRAASFCSNRRGQRPTLIFKVFRICDNPRSLTEPLCPHPPLANDNVSGACRKAGGRGKKPLCTTRPLRPRDTWERGDPVIFPWLASFFLLRPLPFTPKPAARRTSGRGFADSKTRPESNCVRGILVMLGASHSQTLSKPDTRSASPFYKDSGTYETTHCLERRFSPYGQERGRSGDPPGLSEGPVPRRFGSDSCVVIGVALERTATGSHVFQQGHSPSCMRAFPIPRFLESQAHTEMGARRTIPVCRLTLSRSETGPWPWAFSLTSSTRRYRQDIATRSVPAR